MKTGIAHLPLHGGKAPAWLFQRMKKLAAEISIVIIGEYGTADLLRRLSDPYWFQAFGCVLGFDWHSSGVTTTVCGALKEGLKDISKETGFFVCGGKGGVSRQTPLEIESIAERGLLKADFKDLVYASKMSAKVDTCAVQDGYELYHHCFFFDKDGNWAVVQQGMNADTKWARRYHWLSSDLTDFVCEPHKAVCGRKRDDVLNLVAKESSFCRETSALIAREEPRKVAAEFVKIKQLDMTRRHEVSFADIKSENLAKILVAAYNQQPENFEQLLNVQGVGPKTIRALSLISEIIYAKPASFEDPVRFSFAHGGKDAHPYPVNREEYDRSIAILKEAVNHARLCRLEKLEAIKRLSYMR